MKLEMIGLNHTTSVLATRDKAAIPPDRLPDVVARLLGEEHVEGVVVLSTCNRVELYFSPTFHFTDERLRALFAEVCNLTTGEAAQAYLHRDSAAARHLFRVAAGLDSQMLGEVQILAQVKQAYQTALECASTNGFLNRVFLRAIECGKLVRHRTGISQGAVSVAYAAVDLAGRIFGKLNRHKVLLVGAGETIQLASKYLADAGAATWRISNRTRSNAESLAQTLQAVVVNFPPKAEDVAWADIVVSATSSPEPVIRAEVLKQAMQHRFHPLLLLDLAVPRDIEPFAAPDDNIYIYGVDDFNDLVKANLKAREREAARAEKLVEEQVAEFEVWYRENRIAPTIQQLQEVLEGIRSAEVENSLRRFCAADREQVDKFSKSLMKKVASLIVANMKRANADQNDLSLARAVAMAFASEDAGSVNEVIEKLNHELSH